MLPRAVCHLDKQATTWYMRLGQTYDCADNIDQLKKMMVKEFVPSIEKSQAKMSFVALKMNIKDEVDKHID